MISFKPLRAEARRRKVSRGIYLLQFIGVRMGCEEEGKAGETLSKEKPKEQRGEGKIS
jgi:hypothetical protein